MSLLEKESEKVKLMDDGPSRNLNIVASVTVPTKWILATVVTMKKNGKVRLCIDLKPLNH